MTTRQEKLESIAQWEAVLARHPKRTSMVFGYQLAVVLGSNGMTLYFLVTERMKPVDLVVLVALEALMLTALSWMQRMSVPASARMKSEESAKSSPGAQLGAVVFGLVWLGVVYSVSLSLVQKHVKVSIETIFQSGLQWPLALCLFGAFIDSLRDWESLKERGGYFCSTLEIHALPRWLTLFLGAFPFLVPLAAVVKLILWFQERPRSRRSDSQEPMLIFLLMFGVLGVMLWVLTTGVSGWAVGFCSAKIVSELFVVFVPNIASRARGEGLADLRKLRPEAASKGPRPKITPPATALSAKRPASMRFPGGHRRR